MLRLNYVRDYAEITIDVDKLLSFKDCFIDMEVAEKRDLACMRADIVRLEAMYMEGVISKASYDKELAEMNDKITVLEVKYGLR